MLLSRVWQRSEGEVEIPAPPYWRGASARRGYVGALREVEIPAPPYWRGA